MVFECSEFNLVSMKFNVNAEFIFLLKGEHFSSIGSIESILKMIRLVTPRRESDGVFIRRSSIVCLWSNLITFNFSFYFISERIIVDFCIFRMFALPKEVVND